MKVVIKGLGFYFVKGLLAGTAHEAALEDLITPGLTFWKKAGSIGRIAGGIAEVVHGLWVRDQAGVGLHEDVDLDNLERLVRAKRQAARNGAGDVTEDDPQQTERDRQSHKLVPLNPLSEAAPQEKSHG